MTSAKVKQIAINIGFIILAFTVQNCVFPLLPFLAATPNLLLILTFSFGFIHGKNAGMFYGVISGLLLDLFYSGSFGFYTLIYIYIFRFLIRGRLDLPYYFTKIMLPEIIFTAVTTLLIYRLFLSASRRVEDIGKRRDTTIV